MTRAGGLGRGGSGLGDGSNNVRKIAPIELRSLNVVSGRVSRLSTVEPA
jgi:hypothetical protein